MYKREQKTNTFSVLSLRFSILWLLILVCPQFVFSQSNTKISDHHSDTIVVITTSSGNELRGILIAEDVKSITIDIANEEKYFLKNEIKSYEYITRGQIKSIKEFKNPNPIYTKYCYLPSSFINEKGGVSTNSHYLITSNSKFGINDNIEISFGNIFIFHVISSFTFSKEISNSFTGAVSVLGNYNILSTSTGANEWNGFGFIPRLTFGDKTKNTTIGFVGYNLPVFGTFYGGYFGSQRKIGERFTLAGETIGLTIDGYQYLIMTNVILNYLRNYRENWSVGITFLSSNFQNINLSNNGDIVPFPYIGIQRKF